MNFIERHNYLHGGHGTRLRPLTHTGPKQLLPIANKPMSEFCIESMKDARNHRNCNNYRRKWFRTKLEEYYGDGEKFGVKNTVHVEQDSPKGIAHAISIFVRDFIDKDKFLVFLGDNIIQKSISRFCR